MLEKHFSNNKIGRNSEVDQTYVTQLVVSVALSGFIGSFGDNSVRLYRLNGDSILIFASLERETEFILKAFIGSENVHFIWIDDHS